MPASSCFIRCRRFPQLILVVVFLISPRVVSGDDVMLDENGDDMSDVWQNHYEVADDTQNSDPDSDGFDNEEESIAGTDPDSYGSKPALTSATAWEEYPYYWLYEVEWYGVEGVRYQFEVDDYYGGWTPIGPVYTGSNAYIQEDGSAGAEPNGFRLIYDFALDNDGDGLNAMEEGLLETSDSDTDSDDDQLPDGWEAKYELDGTVDTGEDGAEGNPDGDGYNNLEEYQNGTSPLVDNGGSGGSFDWDENPASGSGTSPPASTWGHGDGGHGDGTTSLLLYR